MNRAKLSVGNCAVLELATARAKEERAREISRDHLLAAICIFASGETPVVRWISGERLEEERQALLGFFHEGDPLELLRAVTPVSAGASLPEFAAPIGRSQEAREACARAREIASPDEPLCTHLLAALLRFPDNIAVNSTNNQPDAEDPLAEPGFKDGSIQEYSVFRVRACRHLRPREDAPADLDTVPVSPHSAGRDCDALFATFLRPMLTARWERPAPLWHFIDLPFTLSVAERI